MGNTASLPPDPTDPHSPEQKPAQTMAIPMAQRLFPNPLVVGSPLTKTDTPELFAQPSGEPSYKNSSKISHYYGPTGPRPLLQDAPDASLIPVQVSWTQGGKAVYVSGSFNNWEKPIRMQQRCSR